MKRQSLANDHVSFKCNYFSIDGWHFHTKIWSLRHKYSNFVLLFAIIFQGLKNHLQTKFAKILLMIIFLYIVQLQQIFNCYFCFHSELLKHEVEMMVAAIA